ncbi:MAG: hypothetical protein H0U44_11475 [Flavisolibacter sp.]|nr:hypothetical protein [Flavisolibacter sp.]
MEEFNSGMEPEVRRYFRKIINTISYGVLWLMTIVAAGLFFDLAGIKNGIHWYNIIYFAVALISFLLLIFYFYKTWSEKKV